MTLIPAKYRTSAIFDKSISSSFIEVSERFHNAKRNLVIVCSIAILFSFRRSAQEEGPVGIFGVSLQVPPLVLGVSLMIAVIYHYILFEHEMNRTVALNTAPVKADRSTSKERYFDDLRQSLGDAINSVCDGLNSIEMLRSNDTLRNDLHGLLDRMFQLFSNHSDEMRRYFAKLRDDGPMDNSGPGLYKARAEDALSSAELAFNEMINRPKDEVANLNHKIDNLIKKIVEIRNSVDQLAWIDENIRGQNLRHFILFQRLLPITFTAVALLLSIIILFIGPLGVYVDRIALVH